jgi:hypothetical protein
MENVLAGRARAGASTCFHRLLVTTTQAVNLRSARSLSVALVRRHSHQQQQQRQQQQQQQQVLLRSDLCLA